MARKKNAEPTEASDPNARLITTAQDKAKALKWFDRARELGDKRQYEYAIEYYVNGLEFWPDATEEACKPLHGCGVCRRQTGGKKPGLKDSMTRSMNDKDPRRAFLNALWLFGRDPENNNYIDGVARAASRLRAEDAVKWAAGVRLKALELAPKTSAKQFHSLINLLEELGDRAAERSEDQFAVDAYQMGVDALNLLQRRIPRDDAVELGIKNLSTKLTILKGKYKDGESFRDSIRDVDEQVDLHDQQRSVQSDDRVVELVAKAEEEHKADPDNPEKLKTMIDLLCRRERNDEETRAIGFLLEAYKRTETYRWKHLADDIHIKQLARKVREVDKAGDREVSKKHRIAQLRFELAVFKERVEHYPTDNRVRFEYGIRNFRAGRFDEAIPLFQSSRSDPKNRAACGMYLGRCFFRKGYHDQALGALQEAIEEHDCSDDDMGKAMLYWLARVQEVSSDVEGARKTYGKIMQADYNYSDVRGRLDALPKQG